ncbi:MAG: hypothetical protein JWP80_2831 [Pseudomonas sp.]|nr:hypothetical protein [Pseudomonas sp.]
MSSGMSIASVFVLSSFLLSTHASAEESESFVKQRAARQASIEQVQTEMTAKNNEQTLEKSVDLGTFDTAIKG